MAATVVLCSCLGSGSVQAGLGSDSVQSVLVSGQHWFGSRSSEVIALVCSLEISDLTRALLTRNRNATNVDVDDAWNLVGCLDTHLKICILIVLFHYSGYCILFQNLVIDSLEME
ncbi:hypothetical protein Hdeb2414_s0026g00680941 [Helianthus debilis subsp. tardiflorus]